jgi:hypothetical protein
MDMEATATRPRHRFTVEEFHRMGEAGILGEDDRVVLDVAGVLGTP